MTTPISLPPSPALVLAPGQDTPRFDNSIATDEPAADFAQLLMAPVAPAGAAAGTIPATGAIPAAPIPTPGSSTRLKLSALLPTGTESDTALTSEQLEAAAAMLASTGQLMVAPPPGAAATSPSPAITLPACDSDGESSAPLSAGGTMPGLTLSAPTSTDGTTPGFTLSAPTAAALEPGAAPAEIPAETPAPPAGDNASQKFSLPDDLVQTEAVATTPAALPRTDSRDRTGARIAGVAKNAAPVMPPENPAPEAESSVIKKFLSVEAAGDEGQQGKVGIAVAQSDSAMAAHLPERPNAADLVVQSFAPGSRPDASAPTADIREHRPAVIAQRAVEAVTQVVESQVASRLQPAPGVQLNLKLGGEDIAIRVELREGNVHTQFRTDSNEVRQAIAHEWSVLRTESPERALRYLEPEFSADRPGFSPGGDSRQGAASHQQSRSPQPEIFGAVGRSYPYNRTEADSPVREIAAQLLPTSVHLSAVA